MTTSVRRYIADRLKDKTYRDAYVDDNISTGIASQIKAMRESHGWTQQGLGARLGMAQETISQLEDPNYGRLTMRTLKRLASAFDVALVVRFVTFSNLLDWTTNLSERDLAVPSFDDDKAFSNDSWESFQTASTGDFLRLLEFAAISGQTQMQTAKIASFPQISGPLYAEPIAVGGTQ